MSTQPITIAAVQPAVASTSDDHPRMVATAWELAAQAVEQGAQLLVLPECFNTIGLDPEETKHQAQQAEAFVDAARERCRQLGVWLLLPVIEQRGELRFNAAHLITPSGEIAFTYDKTHLTITERRDLGLTPGEWIPVVDTPLGRLGVMICYDVYFPEVARLLSLRKVDAILFPSLQRSDTPERCMLMSRVRAMDCACHLVRAGYGLPATEAYTPGKVYGQSCVIEPDGTVLADAGLHEGLALAQVDLHTPWTRHRCSGAPPEPVRDFLQEDRRPELYGDLTRPTSTP